MLYDDSKEYLNFLKENGILISREPYREDERVPAQVVRTDQDWNKITDEWNSNQLVVIDNFIEPEFLERLRQFVLYLNVREDYYNGYAAINYSRTDPSKAWFPLLTNITEECKELLPFLKGTIFRRGWSFIYSQESDGVSVHADPANININLWVTPNFSLNLNEGMNGLDIWKITPPQDWDYNDYNKTPEKSMTYIKEQNAERVRIPYECNRAIIFNSLFFHKTQKVSSKEGYKNKRINYTFLYA